VHRVTTATDLYWDPYETSLSLDPYPAYRRLREEAPLYHNDKHDFYACSLFEDCEKGLKDNATFISGRGALLELIKADLELPPGTLIFEDAPAHTIHRSLLVRVFTPRRVAALEPKIRAFAAQHLDAMIGEKRFDLIGELGAQMPMKVISMLLGIPESDQEAVRDQVDKNLRTRPGEPMRYKNADFATGNNFHDYIEWRKDNPSDDLMTVLLHTVFEDEHGVRRTLTFDEAKTYTAVVSFPAPATTAV
jgi:cytochrome P450